jgi:hypothetical protein
MTYGILHLTDFSIYLDSELEDDSATKIKTSGCSPEPSKTSSTVSLV